MRVFSDKKSNMDFMLNGPRLQINMIDGWETCYGQMRTTNGLISNVGSHDASITSFNNIYPQYNDIYLNDTFNGRQFIANSWWPSSNMSYSTYVAKFRYALRTTTPGYYLVITNFTADGAGAQINYVKTGVYPISSTIPAINLTVELDRSQWKYYNNSAGGIGQWDRMSRSDLWAGAVNYLDYLELRNDNSQGFTVTNIYCSRTVTDSTVTTTIEFPANTYSIRSRYGNMLPMLPYDLGGRGIKMGGWGDRVLPSLTNDGGAVVEVYSPIKGCMCLKTYVNGEIPILN